MEIISPEDKAALDQILQKANTQIEKPDVEKKTHELQQERLDAFNKAVCELSQQYQVGIFVFACPVGPMAAKTPTSINTENLTGDQLVAMFAYMRRVPGVTVAQDKESALFMQHTREQYRNTQVAEAVRSSIIKP